MSSSMLIFSELEYEESALLCGFALVAVMVLLSSLFGDQSGTKIKEEPR